VSAIYSNVFFLADILFWGGRLRFG